MIDVESHGVAGERSNVFVDDFDVGYEVVYENVKEIDHVVSSIPMMILHSYVAVVDTM
jgi:hypothetical protein